MNIPNQRGVTLLELLIVMIIGVIVLLALAIPLVSSYSLLSAGKRQTESQRDAQLVTRAIAFAAREAKSYLITGDSTNRTITFTVPTVSGTCTVAFQGGPAFNGGQLSVNNQCLVTPWNATLINGSKSKVIDPDIFTVVSSDLVKIRLNVEYENQRNELLETEIFLRNA